MSAFQSEISETAAVAANQATAAPQEAPQEAPEVPPGKRQRVEESPVHTEQTPSEQAKEEEVEEAMEEGAAAAAAQPLAQDAKDAEEEGDGWRVKIKGCTEAFADAEVRQLFEGVESISWAAYQDTKRPTGDGWVTFSNLSFALRALEFSADSGKESAKRAATMNGGKELTITLHRTTLLRAQALRAALKKQALADTKATADAYDELVHRCEQEKKELVSAVATLQQELCDQKETNTTLQETNTTLQETNTTLRKELEIIALELTTLQETNTTLQKELEIIALELKLAEEQSGGTFSRLVSRFLGGR